MQSNPTQTNSHLSSASNNGSRESDANGSASASASSGSNGVVSLNQRYQPLLLKCHCEDRLKKIRYPDINVSFIDFHSRIATSLQFETTDFIITWEDDDGEFCEISSDEDLSEAISFFSPNDNGSSGSDHSHQSTSMRVCVKVDTAINLSDFGSELSGDNASLMSGSEGSYVRGDSAWNGNRSANGWSGSGHQSRHGSPSASNSRGNPFNARSVSKFSSNSRSKNGAGQHGLGLDDLDLDLDSRSDMRGLRKQLDEIDTREGRTRSREEPTSRRRSGSNSSDSDDQDLSPTATKPSQRRDTRRSSHSSSSDLDSSNTSSNESKSSGRSVTSSLPPINPYLPPPLAISHTIASALWNRVGQGVDSQNQGPASWANVARQLAQDLAEASAAHVRTETRRAKAEAQRSVDVRATRLIADAEALGVQALRGAQSWKSWATGSSSRRRDESPLSDEPQSTNGLHPRLSSETLDRAARLLEEAERRTKASAGDTNGSREVSSFSFEEKRSRQAYLDDGEGLSLLGFRSDLGPPQTSYSLGETGYAGDSFSDHGSDSGDSIATVSRGSPPMGAADSASSSRRGVERSESSTTLRAADHRALQALQQEPWTNEIEGQTSLPERDCQCMCSKCRSKFDADSLRYVCDQCGPRRLDSTSASTSTSNPSSPSSSISSPSRSVISDRTQITSSTTSSSNSRIQNDDTSIDLAEAWSDAVSESSQGSDDSLISIGSISGESAATRIDTRTRSQRGNQNGIGESSAHSDPEIIGFELCFSCMHAHSREHVDEHSSSSEGVPSVGAPITPVSRGARSRSHAFFELIRKDGKWTTVEDECAKACKHCGTEGWTGGRFKCSSCDDLSLCHKCFMNVSDIHPIHVFLRMPTFVPLAAISPVNQMRGLPPSEAIHELVRCTCCSIPSIRGVRYHCASCVGGADFCSSCEENGRAIDSRSPLGHKAEHILIKLSTPLTVSAVSSRIGNSLIRAQQRLYAEAERGAALRTRGMQLSSSEPVMRTNQIQNQPEEAPPAWDDDTSSAWRQARPPPNLNRTLSSERSIPNNNWYSLTRSHSVPCSACGSEILGSRFLCANCPLKERPGSQGFNLCSNCEASSLELHDPSHFFLKIRSDGDRAPALALNPYTENLKNLLPPLYKDVIPRPGLADLNLPDSGDARALASRCFAGAVRRFVGRSNETIEMQRLNGGMNGGMNDIVPIGDLVHASILCDRCYEVIEGAWLRCCNCITSFDICSRCEPNVEHDKDHVFAVFKQPVDMALFKSLVDHGDGGDGHRGAAMPMLSYLIV